MAGDDHLLRRVVVDGFDHLAARGLGAGRLDIGITSDLPDLVGFGDFTRSAKPLGDYARAWEAFVAMALPHPRVVVIGGGIGGVELALASAHRLRAMGAKPQVTLVDRGAQLLGQMQPASRAGLMAALRAYEVEVLSNLSPLRAEAGAVVLSDGRCLASDFTLTVAGARPQAWVQATGLALTDGFVAVAHFRPGDRVKKGEPIVQLAGIPSTFVGGVTATGAGFLPPANRPLILRDIAAGREKTQDTTTLEDYNVLAKLRESDE